MHHSMKKTGGSAAAAVKLWAPAVHCGCLICALLFVPLASYAGENAAGTASAVFLKLPSDVRSVGMGEAVTAVAGDSASIFQNPAGLAGNAYFSASFMRSMWTESIHNNVLSVAGPWSGPGAVALGVQYLTYGELDSRSNSGAPAGDLSPRDIAVSAGWGIELQNEVRFGLAGKYIDSKISNSASAFALDFGVQKSHGKVLLGAALSNLGGKLKFDREAYPLPRVLKLGAGIPVRGKWLLAFDVNLPSDGPAWFGAGGEYSRQVSRELLLSVRAGYDTSVLDTGETNGFSTGFSVGMEHWGLDYGFKMLGMLGNTHHIGIRYKYL